MSLFSKRYLKVVEEYENLICKKNSVLEVGNGIFSRYKNPVLTKDHAPYFWKYDLNEITNPYFMERLGVNAALNPGAIIFDNKICLMVRVEGTDRKSFFAVAESENGIDNFRFWDYPIIIPENDEQDGNIYDMRLVRHEDGWIYGLFCREIKDPNAKEGDMSSAVAYCGIARSKNLKDWERLPDLKTKASQQRNVVLHPEFIDKKYAFYTRPTDDFIEAGKCGGIGWGLSDSMENPIIDDEKIIDVRMYHTIKETKNGQGAAPIKTDKGWIHIAHGVRNTAAGLRYVLYGLLSDLDDPSKIIKNPGGYLICPEGIERVGDVSNVVFCNGMVKKDDGTILIYYASADTRVHVAETTVDKLLDYLMNTPEDALRSYACTIQRNDFIKKNLDILKKSSS
ncbi:MAG: glycosidase [Clostridiales bacterium]